MDSCQLFPDRNLSPGGLAGRFTLPLALAITLLCTGCSSVVAPSRDPMPSLTLHQPATGPNPTTENATAALEAESTPCAVVLLPGSFDRPKKFERKQFDDILARQYPQTLVVAADAHMGYYRTGQILDRLRHDVVSPLREKGYRVWLAGISLGGLGSLLYSLHGDVVPGEIEGLVTMAPFLGEDELIAEIAAAGGPLVWRSDIPLTGPPSRKTVGPLLWTRIAEWHAKRRLGEEPTPEMVLAYGQADGFAPAGEMLASLLPPEKVFTHPAGHDWDAWIPLWRDVVAAGVFGGCT